MEIQRLARSVDDKVTAQVVNSVLELLRAEAFVRDEKFDSDSSILTFSDCTLSLVNRCTRAHSAGDYVTSKLPFAFDPTQPSPSWHKFLSTTVTDATAGFLQEFAGYCLTTSTRYELAVWLWGPPGGGKSTFIEGLRAMLGPRSCILGLQDIEHSRFALTQLPGKTMAISTEQPSGYIKNTHSLLNAIISGEAINIDRKFRDQITLIPRAKLVWGMNELPRIDSGGVGLFRRVVPVHFDSIPADRRDPALKETILTEGMGIVNWALAGLSRLEERGKFEIPTELTEAREVYRVQNDVPQLFVDECCEQIPGRNVRSSSLYEVYKGWCKRNGHGVQSSTAFAAEMKRLGFQKQKMRDGAYWLDLEMSTERQIDMSDYDDIDLEN